MFNKSKYTKWYFSIVKSRKEMNRQCFTEKHHIIPKCLGGKNNVSNIVKLTPREHFICHKLLYRMVTTKKNKQKMAYAIVRMKTTNSIEENRRCSSAEFERVRKIISKSISGVNNPFYGKGHFGVDNVMSNPNIRERHRKSVNTKKYIKLQSEQNKGKLNSFYGKHHSKKTKDKLSSIKSQKIKVLFLDGTYQIFSQYKNLGLYLGKSSYLGGKLCNKNFKHLWIKYNIQNITKIKE